LLQSTAATYLKLFKGKPYIFNLGHGIIKETDPDHVTSLISFVRSHEPKEFHS
jgi:uroporphyrinogen decarboxylase